MTSIRKVRKAFKRKNGIKSFNICFKDKKGGKIHFTPTMKKLLRQNVAESFKTNFAARNVH
ncbi:hypothetical protein HMPREF0658_1315 [Hoylesella marshii DSM 16973 = JCM 13450]|uniref:Uncharacterized protein n=1 Tax=Hoylesella marshii DSM 16973 = JCM 13450 TaxID=862515 RepID=E0NSW3_9BACT|nr:hypothetical protein HMPREF0658_1315 [Hoylesella marshii DSM 16973 = JCM 13450]